MAMGSDADRDSHCGGLGMAGLVRIRDSAAMVGSATRTVGRCELALGLGTCVAAGRDHHSPDPGCVPANAASAAALLLPGYFDRADSQRDLDRVAIRALVPVARARSH